jgi:hypothetical protein
MKPGRVHRVPLSARAISILEYLAQLKSGDFVFPGHSRGKPLSNMAMEMTETALSHVIGDKAEQAYRRSDALDKRRKLMDAWAAHCEPKVSSNIVEMKKRHH